MSKRIYTTYVDVMLRCGTTTSDPVGCFEFDHTEDAIIFGSDLVRRLDSVLMDHDEVIGVSYTHTMRDYVNIYIDTVHSDYGFERVWPVASARPSTRWQRVPASSSFPMCIRRFEMAFVEDTIIEILHDAAGLVTLSYGVERVGHNRYEIDGITFVVSKVFGDILIQEYGTNLYLDVKQRRAFQLAGGREVGLTSYEAFGVYPQNRRSVRNWLRNALAVAMYLSIMYEVLGDYDEAL